MVAIEQKELLVVRVEPDDGRTHYGGDQDWFPTEWQRMAGCGPLAVSNLIYYHERSAGRMPQYDKPAFVGLMEDVWRDVTPGCGGISSTRKLAYGLDLYAQRHRVPLEIHRLDVGKERQLRPSFGEVSAFLAQALSHNQPAPFLSLDGGGVAGIDDWHWITIIALDGDIATITDEGLLYRVDLHAWCAKSTLGGGFVWAEWA